MKGFSMICRISCCRRSFMWCIYIAIAHSVSHLLLIYMQLHHIGIFQKIWLLATIQLHWKGWKREDKRSPDFGGYHVKSCCPAVVITYIAWDAFHSNAYKKKYANAHYVNCCALSYKYTTYRLQKSNIQAATIKH